MKDNSKKEKMLTVIGSLLILIGVLCNEWILIALFNPDGVISFSNRVKIYIFEVILLFFGFFLLKNRSSEKLQSIVGKIVKAIFKKAIYVLFIMLTMEVLSYFSFHYLTPDRLIERAYSALGLSDKRSLNVSWSIPNLWSNYSPNPLSLRCNKYGWRYGGGPKTYQIRILCLGGSTTWSSNVEWGELSYPAQLEKYLRRKGYDVDVVNGGVGYYSSAEVLATLCFRGVYVNPDIVLIGTGGNDIEPLMSPNPYSPDYSHWRRAGGVYWDALFRQIWERFPSWTIRFFSMIALKPGTGGRVGKQLTNVWDAILATNSINNRYPLGLESNLWSMIAITGSIGAEPIIILFKNNPDHPNSYWEQIKDSEVRNRAKERARFAMKLNNSVMASVANTFDVPVIPFDQFETSSDSLWTDHCHLNAEGCVEKAEFIGDWLISENILNNVLEEKSNE